MMAGHCLSPDDSPQHYRVIAACGGLPFVGERRLEDCEIRMLNDEYDLRMLKMVLCFAGIPGSVVFLVLFGYFLTFVPISTSTSETILSILGVSLLLLGIPILILLGNDHLKRGRILKRAFSQGSVRCFQGKLNIHDWTDKTHVQLRKTGLLHADSQDLDLVELFVGADVIYRLNGTRPRQWIATHLTRGAAPDGKAPHYSLPKEWTLPGAEHNLERRRLTEEEKNELRYYAEQMRRRSWICLAFFSLAFLGIRRITMDLLNISLPGSLILSLGISFGMAGPMFIRNRRVSFGFEQDAQNGWAIVQSPTGQSEKTGNPPLPGGTTEFLTHSRAVWTVSGLPAGWRKHL